MKAAVAKLLPLLREETERAREANATKLLNLDVVREAIHAAALQGQYGLRLRVPGGVNLRGTAAAEALTRWARKEGLQIQWERRHVDLEDGRRVEVAEPEISWDQPAK